MGLLTDPSSGRRKLPSILIKNRNKLCVLSYMVGVAWFLMLAYRPYNAGTYFSENALLPGLVRGDYNEENVAQNYLEDLKHEAERYESGMPHPWLVAAFTQLGLDTYVQNFTLNYPFGSESKFSGKNVYAILRAPRASSTESVVMSAPYRSPTSIHTGTAPSIALMLSLAKFFRKQIYWAKDIIFVVSEHEQLGMQAWLEAYHRESCGRGVLDYGDVEGRGGAIQAAINLELHASRITYVDVKVEGLNGQLPNLDLSNLIHRLCVKEGVRHTFKGQEDPLDPESWEGWVHSLHTLFSMIITQASGVPNGNHGLFHRFGIESVTLEGVEDPMYKHQSVGLYHVGRILEGTFRSLNNLLERFHQSFFFYLLAGTGRYISIGMYMPAYGLIAAPLLVMALSLWCEGSDEEDKQKEENNKTKKREKKIVLDYDLVSFLPLLVVVHAFGLLLYNTPKVFSQLSNHLGFSSQDAVFWGFVASNVASLTIPFYFVRFHQLSDKSWKVLKYLALLELATLLFSVSMYNFSLALIVTAIYVPVVAFLAPSAGRLRQHIQRCFLLLIHPLMIIYASVVLATLLVYPEDNLSEMFDKSVNANKLAIMYSIMDGYIYGNWAFDVACLVLVPNWLLFWTIPMTQPKITQTTK